MDYREKIRKLLNLAESPNEHEARAALLKARELMREHKLTEAECTEAEKKAVKRIMTGFFGSKRKEPWLIELSAIIGENYCCQAYRTREKGKQRMEIGFVGLEDDVELCNEIFRFAVMFCRGKCEQIRREDRNIYAAWYVNREMDSFGYGFAGGVQKAFDRQKKEKEAGEAGWALVLTIPKEVKEESKDMKRENFDAFKEDYIVQDKFVEGYVEGKKFKPGAILKGENA